MANWLLRVEILVIMMIVINNLDILGVHSNLSILRGDSIPRFVPDQIKWQTGQIIGISEPLEDPSTFFFEIVTGSRFGHIGIVVVAADGRKRIYHSDPKGKGAMISPLTEFLNRSLDQNQQYQAALVVPNELLNDDQRERLISVLERVVADRIPYNHKQYMNNSSMNCSEFVYHAFLKVGIELGFIEGAAAFNYSAFNGGLRKYWSPQIPDGARYISPFSIIAHHGTRIIASNLPINQILSEREILDSWQDNGGLRQFTQLIILGNNRLSFREIDKREQELYEFFKSRASTQPYRNMPIWGAACNDLSDLAQIK